MMLSNRRSVYCGSIIGWHYKHHEEYHIQACGEIDSMFGF